jgi:tagatose-1,6-bisphosphate aldolase non-catalytic subunit AgaZ/GatZ
VPIKGVVDRTWELISYCEAERQRLGVGHISYEVGTEEVHGGLADIARFQNFVAGLHERLNRNGLNSAWPCFIVGKVGTDLHTTDFDPQMAHVLYEIVAPLGSLIKGHYSDWVSNPEAYPVHGVGGANVGPEFTSVELAALEELTAREADMARGRPGLQRSDFMAALRQAVVDSGRWRKWLQPGEQALPFDDLAPARRRWLVSTGARYVWTAEPVQEARRRLYDNLAAVMPDPASFVIDRIAQAIEHYITAFRLFDILTLIGDAPAADTRARV